MCFEDGEGASKECHQSLEAGKVKRKDSLPEPPERKSSRVHSEFVPVRPVLDF